ncbi:MAG: M56 family metallopeptidase [Planctomycetaceae bacterium]|nr:M56 family metallopeptidase [Planctomycetaceae bacterium]
MATLLQFALLNAGLVTGLALLVTVASWRLRRPALIHALWILVLAKLVTPPLIEVAIELPAPINVQPEADLSRPARSQPFAVPGPAKLDCQAPSSTAVDCSVTGCAPSAAETGLSGSALASLARRLTVSFSTLADRGRQVWHSRPAWLSLALCSVWGVGSCIWFARQGWRIWRFRERLVLAVPAPAAIQQQAARLAAEMGLRRCPGVILVSDVVSPMLSGVIRTRLVFPMGLLERLDPQARGTLLAHELAHFGRKDQWVRALELVVTGVYWWHPVVWWARRQIEASEEECCDAWVVTQSRASPRVAGRNCGDWGKLGLPGN